MAKATMKDVATLANVSVATVDRVLHEREGVSSRARQRVKEAIHELGFRQLPARLSRKVRGRIKLLFLLPQLTTGFVTQMIEDLKQAHDAVPDVEVMVEIKRIPLISGTEIIEALSKVKARDYQGVGLFAVDAPGVRSAIDDCMARGVPVVTLVSDVPSSRRVSFVGIDNMAAGRTAGRLMGKFLRGVSGEIAIITGNMQIRDHVERQMGFRQVLGAEHRDLRILSAVEGNSIAAKNHSITIDLLRDQKARCRDLCNFKRQFGHLCRPARNAARAAPGGDCARAVAGHAPCAGRWLSRCGDRSGCGPYRPLCRTQAHRQRFWRPL